MNVHKAKMFAKSLKKLRKFLFQLYKQKIQIEKKDRIKYCITLPSQHYEKKRKSTLKIFYKPTLPKIFIDPDFNFHIRPPFYSQFSFEDREYLLTFDQTKKMIQLLNEIIQYLSANDIEIINATKKPVKSTRYWDPSNWKKIWSEDLKNTQGNHYKKYIYPTILAHLSKLLKKQSAIVEFCSGDGALAKMIFDLHSSKIKNYTLIDFNESSCQNAQKKLKKNSNASFLQQDVTIYPSKIKKGSVDIVLGIGALTHYVLKDKSSAIKALSNASKMLKKNGFLVLTGLTQQWLSSEDLEKKGLKVLNRSTFTKENNLLQLYIAKKTI
ncbi:MAG: class I SAM-dependent methyltransferase [Chlamydiae bacterium]|nr:class I SAM-dependent methyltransferase [Chlamydiota bacterium]